MALLALSFSRIAHAQATIAHQGPNGTTDNGSTPVTPCSQQTFLITSYTTTAGNDICFVEWQWQFSNSSTLHSVTLQGNAPFTINVTADMTVSCTITLGTPGCQGTHPTYGSNTLHMTVVPQTLSFSSSNTLASCGSTQTYSINPISCAVSYTYAIGQSTPGVYFTGTSSLQTLTTTATNVGVTFPTGNGSFVLYVTPNYADGTSGSSVGAPYTFGVPPLTIFVTKYVGITAFISTQNYAGYTYTWTVNGGMPNGGSIGATCEDELNCGHPNPIHVTATNACGTANASGNASVACGGGGPLRVGLTPNPSHGVMKITLEKDPSVTTQPAITKIRAVRIVDLSGKTLRKFEFGSGVTEATINTAGLLPNMYILHIYDGKEWTHKEIVVK